MNKIVVCGYGGVGKDGLCEILATAPFNLTSMSSSWVAKEYVYANSPELQRLYYSPKHAWEHRCYHRQLWKDLISEYNTPDKTRLAERIFASADIYCGMRKRDELLACKNKWKDLFVLWLEASERIDPVGDTDIRKYTDCHMILPNNGDIRDLINSVSMIPKVFAL